MWIPTLLALRLGLNCLALFFFIRISFNQSLLVLSALTSFIVVARAGCCSRGLILARVLTVTVSPLVIIVWQEMLAKTFLGLLRGEHRFKLSDCLTDFWLI